MHINTRDFFTLFIFSLVAPLVLTGCAPATLGEAVIKDDVNQAKRLIQAGANVNEKFDVYGTGFKPLCFSAPGQSDHRQMVQLLLSMGADVNAGCDIPDNPTPLHLVSNQFTFISGTSTHNSVLMAKLLIENKANVNAITSVTKRTPLMMASLQGNTELVKLLIQNGADSSMRDGFGKTASDYAKESPKYLADLKQGVAEINEQVQERIKKDRAESREFWKGAGALATGIAVGNATKGYSPDQQARMMKSSIKGVMDGDASEFHATSEQVMAEAQQENNAKIKAIQDQRVRDQKPADVKRTQVNAYDQTAPRFTPLTNVDRKNYRCADSFTASSAPRWTKAEASEEALRYAKVGTYGTLGLNTLSSEITSCKFESGLGYTCIAKTKFERDSTVPCTSGPKAPSEGVAK